MKISYQWLNEWVDLSGFKASQEVADLLTARGLEVEGVERQDQGLDKVISGVIVEKVKHPEADRLSLCKLNIGAKNEDGTTAYLDIVCGAQNIKVGDVVPVAQVGALLPNGMKIEKGKIRGQVSLGMLCSETELGLAKESEGLLILPVGTPVGWKIADVLGLDDTLFEIKLTANRGDCLSHRGMAREVASAIAKPLKNPKVNPLSFTGSPIKISLEAGEDAPQFFGCAINGVKVGPSPQWLKRRLEAIGQRSINNIVDISNFLMFEYGFPVHIYDADKLEGGVISVRRSQKGEKLPLLDGGEVETTGEELIIADGKKPIGLAGVMGGGNSEVSDTTKNVFLECAEFNPTLVRRAAFRFTRRSEASLRFEKGIDPSGHALAISRLADLVIKVAGGDIVGSAKAQLPSREKFTAKKIKTSIQYINQFLGTNLAENKILDILKSLECEVKADGTFIEVTSPTYRLDLNIPQDIAEEVARSIGYDAIPTSIPALSGMPKPSHGNVLQHRLDTIDSIKDILAGEGLTEVLNYSFQGDAWIQKFGMKSSVKVLNPISEEQGYMVPSLLPGMMKAYQENERHAFGANPPAIRLFEVRPVFHAQADQPIEAKGESETGVKEHWVVSFLISGPRFDQAIQSEQSDVDFFDLKAIVENLFDKLSTKGIRMRAADSTLLDSNPEAKCSQLYHSGQTIQVAAGKEAIGFFGRIHPKLEAELKLRNAVYWAEFKIDPVISLTPMKERAYKAWSSFPTMERDFALLVDETVPAENLIQSAIKYGKPIAKIVKIFDTYKGAHIPEGKISIGIRVIFSDDAKSLEEKQVDQCSEIIVKKWQEEFKAGLRG
jgi:phenylalanyl-tRNA synthetase beta chain